MVSPGFQGEREAVGRVAARRLVVIAASAGGLAPLIDVLASLRTDFKGAVVVVQHRSDHTLDMLPSILARRVRLRIALEVDGQVPEAGVIYICPPGMHMTVGAVLRVVSAPRLKFVRPSVDLMLKSAAEAYGRGAIGVVLSGSGTDGALGSGAIVKAGGIVIAQDATAAYRSMPEAAASGGPAQFVLPPRAIGLLLVGLVNQAEGEGLRAGASGAN